MRLQLHYSSTEWQVFSARTPTGTGKSRRMAGFHSFYQALLCTYKMTKKSLLEADTPLFEN